MGLPPGRRSITSQVEPAWVMVPPCSSAIMPARTSDDLPLPEVPTTARNRFVRSSCKQRRGLLLAAEEQVVLVAAKRTQAGKRIGERGVNGLHHPASFACRMAATKSVSNSGCKCVFGLPDHFGRNALEAFLAVVERRRHVDRADRNGSRIPVAGRFL